MTLTSEQRATLQSWLTAGKTEQRLAFRAQIILALDEGLSNLAVAERLATRPATVSKWRGRFAQHGLAGVADAPRSGKPRHYDTSHEHGSSGAIRNLRPFACRARGPKRRAPACPPVSEVLSHCSEKRRRQVT